MRRLVAPLLLWCLLSSPSLANVLCVQHGLDRLGYTVGTADGDIGGKTRAAAAAFAEATGHAGLPELSAETSAAWCKAIKQTLAGSEHANARSLNGIYDFELDLTSTPSKVLTGARLEKYWHMHETAKTCMFEIGDFAENDTPHLSLPKIPARTFAAVVPEPVFTPAQRSPACRVEEPLTARLGELPWDNTPPEPLVRIDTEALQRIKDVAGNTGAGEDTINFAGLWFATAQARATLQPEAGYSRQLIDVLLAWAKADALQEVQKDGGRRGPVLYGVTTMIAALLNGYVSTAMQMTPEERAVIGPWLQRAVQKIAASPGQRQSNQVIGFSLILATWGLSTGDVASVQWAIDNYKRAIHEMRPDGTFPRDSSRGGSGLHYQGMMTGNMVLLAALLERSLGLPLLDYAVDGRSISDAVAWNLAAIDDPVTYNRKYAIPCPIVGDNARHTIDTPAVDRDITATFAVAVYYVTYALLRPDAPISADILKRFVTPTQRAAFHPTMGAAPLCVLGLNVADAKPVDLATLPDPSKLGNWTGLSTRTIEMQSNPLDNDSQFNALMRTSVRRDVPPHEHITYNLMGNYSLSDELEKLTIVLDEPVGEERPAGLDACSSLPQTVTYNGPEHFPVLKYERVKTEWVPVDVECIASALPEHAAFSVRYLGTSLKTIASDLVTSGGLEALEAPALRRVVASIADGSLPIGKAPEPRKASGPAQTRTIEIMSTMPPGGSSFHVLLNTTVRGGKKGSDFVAYNIEGYYNATRNTVLNLRFVLDQNIGQKIPKGLSACAAGVTMSYPGDKYVFPVLAFKAVDGRWVAPEAECIAAAIPKDVAFMVRYLAESLDVIAQDLVATGAVDNLQSESLRGFMTAVAEGKVLVGSP